MVQMMKGQIFILDLGFAFIIYCFTIFIFFSSTATLINSSKMSYEEFEIQKKLFDASEMIISTSNISRLGLAVYEENTVKHHMLDMKKVNQLSEMNQSMVKEMFMLEDYEVCIQIKTRNNEEILPGCEEEGIKITRFAICGDEECVLEIWAR